MALHVPGVGRNRAHGRGKVEPACNERPLDYNDGWPHSCSELLSFEPGKVQEEELDSCRAAGERGRIGSGMRVQGETKAGSPCAFFECGTRGGRLAAPLRGH
jgi:hypothetical protein